jgi:hypothetical protein
MSEVSEANSRTRGNEVRVVNKITGGEKGSKDQRFDLVPMAAVGEISEVYQFGSKKYEDHNWRKGYNWGLSYSALQRHLALWQEGEDLDEESGLSHLAHAGWHILTLLTFAREHPELDDRFFTIAQRRPQKKQSAAHNQRLAEINQTSPEDPVRAAARRVVANTPRNAPQPVGIDELREALAIGGAA